MNRIVRHNYPVETLPPDLREGLEGRRVTVVIEASETEVESGPKVSLADILARRRPPYLTKEQIDEFISRERDAWED